MKYPFIICVFLAILCSCSNKSSTSRLMYDVDTYIEEYPDSALTVLQNIDSSLISNKKIRAKYALLMSKALDKNYIDKTDFSVLQPAVDYYSRFGNANEKLEMYYYAGVIHMNRGDNESAMKCFVKAMDLPADSLKSLTKARLFYSKAKIHNSLYEFDKYVDNMLKAAYLFKEKNNYNYFRSLCQANNGYMLMNDSTRSAAILDSLSKTIDYNNIKQIATLYEHRISHSTKFISDSVTLKIIDSYLQNIPFEYINWLSLANDYAKMHMYDKGLEAIKKHDKYSSKKDTRYYSIASRLHENLGNESEALRNYKMYIHLSDSTDLVIFKQDTKFIEERYKMQLNSLKKSNQDQHAIFILIIAVILLTNITIAIKLKLKTKTYENERYKFQCTQLQNEMDTLKISLQQDKIIKDGLKDVITQRVSLLNTIIAATISENYRIDKKAREEMDKLISDRKKFIFSTIAAFEICHPEFIKGLKDNDLNFTELGYCCLYALGLNGKEVGEYTKMSRHYIINHEIRKKLGLKEQDSNLNKYIIQLLLRSSQ